MDMTARIWSRVDKTGNCWIWLGGVTGRGYGSVNWNGRTVGVHRLVYEDAFGPIPPGLTVDHLCRVKVCVNPAHMEIVTVSENVRRQRGSITHCPKGHPYAPENLIASHPTRKCRECHNARRRKPNGYGPRTTKAPRPTS